MSPNQKRYSGYSGYRFTINSGYLPTWTEYYFGYTVSEPDNPCHITGQHVHQEASGGTWAKHTALPTYPTMALVAKLCDGAATNVDEYFDAPAGSSNGNSGGVVEIIRELGRHAVGLDQPAERWSAATINGKPAVVLVPVIDTIGTAAVAVVNQVGDASETTLLRGAGVTSKFLVELAQEIYR